MKQIAVAVFLFLIGFAAVAQDDKANQYIATYKDIAIAEMQRSGVPAAITLAQGMLESGYGQSDLCLQSNNHFGIKCKDEWIGERVYHDDDAKNECFRKYATPALSYQDHSEFLKTRAHYNFLFKLDPADYEAWAKGLKKAGYATEKDYPQRLIQVIRTFNLNQYTLAALQNNSTPVDVASNNAAKPKQDTEILGELIIPITAKKLQENVAKHALQPDAPDDTASSTTASEAKVVKPLDAPNTTASGKYAEGVFTINKCKVLFAKKGTSLLSIAAKYDIALSKLLEFNELTDIEILPADQLVFMEKKPKKGAVDFHVVAVGETLADVCQAEGVRLESVLEYNNLKKDAVPVVGTKIYLRGIPVHVATAASKALASGTF